MVADLMNEESATSSDARDDDSGNSSMNTSKQLHWKLSTMLIMSPQPQTQSSILVQEMRKQKDPNTATK